VIKDLEAKKNMLFAVLFIHLLHPIRFITHPWGGATAVKRKPFEQYGVREVWAKNILDDFPLGLTLLRHGIRCYPVSMACLETPLDGLKMGGSLSAIKLPSVFRNRLMVSSSLMPFSRDLCPLGAFSR
jgi:hypothetical protein